MKVFTKLVAFMAMLFFSLSLQSQEFDGYALYNRSNQNITYLIDKNGDIAHTWSLQRPCNYAVLLMPTGNIMRGAVNQGNQINGAAVGGMVQEIDPDGNVVWEFIYSNSDHVAHHDITLMPDGNVLLIAWEVKNSTELDEMGYTGNSSIRYPTHLIEVSQNGTVGEIVWEWHIWDHLIQDVDPNKPNYGVVSEHPELMNINVQTSGGGGPGGGGGDWFHVNGVDYNEELDQIAFSSRFLSEVFIIDHSTTTEEAAGHTGGNSGKGGDLLYRWGNPSNYGAPGAQAIAGPVHDVRWIEDDGRPRGGFLQFFNNEGVGGTSTVDAIDTPLSADGYNYDYTAGEAYGPSEENWRHFCEDNANGQSASNSMPNGNVFVNLSNGYMYEATSDGVVIWQYGEGPQKAFRYTCDYPGIAKLVEAGAIDNLCELVSTEEQIISDGIKISPNPSTGIFNIDGLPQDYAAEKIQVLDLMGKVILETENTDKVDLTNQTTGMYFITIHFENEILVAKKVSVVK